MQKIANLCFQPIQLYHDYRQAIVDTPLPNVCSNLVFAIIQALVEQFQTGGNTYQEIFTYVTALCSEESTSTSFDQALNFTQRRGITVVIPQISPSISMRYTLSPSMDSNSKNRKYVIYLIQSLGGFDDSRFSSFFIPYAFPGVNEFSLTDCQTATSFA